FGLQRMLSAIDFDDQTRGQADEIDDVVAESILATKAKIADLLAAKEMPELLFRIGGVLAQLFDDRIGRHLWLPLPLPPPARGGGFSLPSSTSNNRTRSRSTGTSSASNHGLRLSQAVLRQLGWGR